MIQVAGLQITVFQILATVIGISLLVFIHELGHFFMAKRFKIRVERFTLGFGPEIFGFTYGGTRYSLCAIPLGGMVKMPGEDVNDATGSPDEFMSQPWYRRLIIALFGPLMNYALAIVLFTAVLYGWGLPTPSPRPVIGEVVAGYPAAAAGLKAGDLIKSIDGAPVKDWESMAGYIHDRPQASLTLEIDRAGKAERATVTTGKDPATGFGIIGIAPTFTTEQVGFLPAAGLSARMAVYQSVFTLKYLGEKLIRWEKPEVAGPIGVVQVLAKAADSGWQSLLQLLAVISVALGLFNLLPIPLVDGGHIFLALVEGIIRRPLSKKAVQIANIIGLCIIISIFLFATYSDITRLGSSMGAEATK